MGCPISKLSPPREVIENRFNFVNKLGYESRRVVFLEILSQTAKILTDPDTWHSNMFSDIKETGAREFLYFPYLLYNLILIQSWASDPLWRKQKHNESLWGSHLHIALLFWTNRLFLWSQPIFWERICFHWYKNVEPNCRSFILFFSDLYCEIVEAQRRKGIEKQRLHLFLIREEKEKSYLNLTVTKLKIGHNLVDYSDKF